jgi:SPP1 gp7 family putative phage head morphogenesis protein
MALMNLRDLVRHMPHVQKMRKRKRVLKGSKPSHALELWYKSQLLAITKQLRLATEQYILPTLKRLEPRYAYAKKIKRDAAHDSGYAGDIKKSIDQAAAQFGGIQRTAQRLSELAAQRAEESTTERLKAAIMDQVGIDMGPIFAADPMADVMGAAIAQNVSLIESIPEQYFGKIEQAVYQNTADGMPFDELAELLKNIADVTDSRAKLIARDQTSKMNGSFNEARQESVGIDKYQWSTSNDERVREEHAANEGEIFSWDDPPDTGHPGSDVNCRCVALPYFDLDKEEADLQQESE